MCRRGECTIYLGKSREGSGGGEKTLKQRPEQGEGDRPFQGVGKCCLKPEVWPAHRLEGRLAGQ